MERIQHLPVEHPQDQQRRERRDSFDRLRAKLEREARAREERATQECRRSDLGLGYLIYCARRAANRSQGDIAQRMGSTQSAVSRWERGDRLPSVTVLERIAAAAGLELMIGLRDPGAREPSEEFVVVGVCHDEGALTELELLLDRYAKDYIPPRPWRAKIEAYQSRQVARLE